MTRKTLSIWKTFSVQLIVTRIPSWLPNQLSHLPACVKRKKMLLFNAPVLRKRQTLLGTEVSIRLRTFALKNDDFGTIIINIYLSNPLIDWRSFFSFQGKVMKLIISYIPEYQNHIRTLKKEGYSIIIGYARNSKGKEDEEVRLRLLQKMIDSLRNRSLVDQVFTSIYSSG